MDNTIIKVTKAWNCDPNISNFKLALDQLNALLHLLLPQIESSRNLYDTRNGVETDALKKFVKSQDSFKFNIVLCMNRYLPWIYDNLSTLDLELVIQYNSLLQGLLLLHSNSRSLFSSQQEMNKILQFIKLDTAYEISISFIATLLHILLKNLDNVRLFEECNGCSIIIKKLKIADFSVPEKSIETSKSTTANQQMLNFKVIEFLIFYFIDESTLDGSDRKTLEQKSDFFRNDFPEIDTLVSSLNDLKNL